MSQGGRQRKLTSNTGATLEDDELFKEIGGQLDANFDYSQWQRTDGGKNTAIGKTSRRIRKYADTPATISTGSVASHLRARSADYVCRHGHHVKPPKKESVLERVDRQKKEEQIKIIQLRIRHRRQTIAEYKKRRKQLLEENIKLKDQIELDEKESHDKVKKLLRKYEKFRGGITTLNDNFMKDLVDVQDERQKTKLQIQSDLAALHRDVEELDNRLKQKQAELHVLLNYKDKEYPVKLLRINELQKQIEDLKVTNMEEEQELSHVVETEVDKYRKAGIKAATTQSEDVMQAALSQMHPSLKDMALQNAVMVKEVGFHKHELGELQDANMLLEREVKALLRHPKTNLRQQLFPEFFPGREKCTPDMDIVLDIPTQEWLPI